MRITGNVLISSDHPRQNPNGFSSLEFTSASWNKQRVVPQIRNR